MCTAYYSSRAAELSGKVEDMLTDYIDLFHYISYISSGFPQWLTLTMVLLHAAFVIVCIVRNRKDRVGLLSLNSRNTVHTWVWLTVLAVLPFLGVILYIPGSIVLYSLLNKHSVRTTGTFKLARNELELLLTAGAIGSVIDYALAKNGSSLTFSYCFELAFMMWLILLLVDWSKNIRSKAAFVRVHPAEVSDPFDNVSGSGSPVPVDPVDDDDDDEYDDDEYDDGEPLVPSMETKEHIFGRLHLAESGAYSLPDKSERSLLRDLRRIAFRQNYGRCNFKNGEFISDKKKYKYSILMDQKEWDSSGMDVCDVRELGSGISRYVVMLHSSDEEYGEKMSEYIIYRITPMARFLFIRAAILLFIMTMLFTPLGLKAFHSTVELLIPLFRKICSLTGSL